MVTALPLDAEEQALAAMRARLHRACLVVRYCWPGDGSGGFYSTWPPYRHDYWDWGAEHWGDTEAERAALVDPSRPRFRASPAEIDAALPTLDLLMGVERLSRHIVAARAEQEWEERLGGWRAIGRRFGCSHVHARRLHDDAVALALLRSRQAETALSASPPGRFRS